MAKLIYVADPMCSWCYGFGPELATLLHGLPEVPLELIVGGLRAYNTKPMDDALRTTLGTHWKKVGETTGLPFSDAGLQIRHFVYDTEPACRAISATGLLAPQSALTVFQAIQHAFYAKGLDVTKGEVLAEIVVQVLEQDGVQIDQGEFLKTWASEEARSVTREDFEQAKRWGVTGFPTLILEHRGELHLVTAGFTRTEDLIQRLQAIIDQSSATEAPVNQDR
ncbi:MAG: DsbA family protein [Oxalicibacterium faecigallinarum]|uniref:DsbA family protein n=1 Tax=Oxalicibacterium faecigallinarum TaxID=573741 RepID=UPI002808BF45|nr:DsbA family protein [Oxalicibacterium faecigallinarum]MDQ7970829.1 DsbA family protein [Oxalicibacterium faecigallinarum]